MTINAERNKITEKKTSVVSDLEIFFEKMFEWEHG